MKQLRCLFNKIKDIKATLEIGWFYFLGKTKECDKIYFNLISKDKIYINIK